MLEFKIDDTKCIQCGLCSKDCPTMIIDGKKGIPEIKEGKEKNCIKCQHCMAICPTGALSIFGKNPEDSVPVNQEVPAAQELGNLMKTRRSIRKFKKEELSKDQIQELLDTAAYAPTAVNKNQVLLSVTETKADLDKVRDLVYDAIKEVKEAGALPSQLAMFGNFQEIWEAKNIDILFRDAPHMIIASAPESNHNGATDCVISLSYFELFANANGVGTLWDGFLKSVFDNIAPDLKKDLGIPVDHAIGYIMIFGKSAVKYTRAIQSDGLHVNKIKL